MSDIFDATRRKISKHITANVAPNVLTEKNAEFSAKVADIATEYIASDRFKKRIIAQFEYAAYDGIRKYFTSPEFRKKCRQIAKDMVK